eukprot:289465-Chlamydomonas_euryale.AAC.2
MHLLSAPPQLPQALTSSVRASAISRLPHSAASCFRASVAAGAVDAASGASAAAVPHMPRHMMPAAVTSGTNHVMYADPQTTLPRTHAVLWGIQRTPSTPAELQVPGGGLQRGGGLARAREEAARCRALRICD